MKTLLKIACVAFAAVLASNTQPGFAQTVYCTNCASEITQLLNLARLVSQLETQGKYSHNKHQPVPEYDGKHDAI